MPVTCDLVRQAQTGLQSGVGGRLISALGALAAADTALRIPTGGQVGVPDLPGLLNTQGIECYSPELGDSIWVTPLQWYANGMSCDGLRDPDREAIQKHLEELEKKRKQIIKQQSSYRIPIDLPDEFPGELPTFKDDNQTVTFEKAGKLEIDSERKTSYLFWSSWQTPAYPVPIPATHESVKENFDIRPGDRLQRITNIDQGIRVPGFTADGITVPSLGFFVFTSSWILRRTWERPAERERRYSQFFRYSESLDRPWYFGDFKVIADVGLDFTEVQYKFTPEEPRPSPRIGWKWEHKEEQDYEETCDMGCSCKDISRLVRQQQQTDQSLRRLIEEIHRATAAGFFRTAQQFSPEQRIEQLGKQIYAQSPGRGGKVPVSNLLDATAALIAAEYHRLGLHKFPANVPKNLIPDPNAALEAIDRDFVDLNTLADYLEWNTKIDDERLGQWPIEYEVTDDGQKKKVYLWNLAEALGDIYGALIKVVEDSDIGVQWGIRSSVEASKAGNAALKALHLLKEFTKFSGALTQEDIIKVQSTFTPDPLQAQTAEDMLKPSTQDITVTNVVDKRSLLGLLLNISYWVQISGRSVYGDLSNNSATRQPNMPGDGIREMRRRSRISNKRWDDWRRKRQQRRNISTSDQPFGGEHPPDIKDISPQQ